MQTHALHLARRVAARGYGVTVVTYRPGERDEREALHEFDAAQPYRIERTLSRVAYHHNVARLLCLIGAIHPDLIYASTVFYGEVGRRGSLPIVARSVGNDVLRPWLGYPFRPGSAVLGHPRVEAPLVRAFQKLNRPEWLEGPLQQTRRRLMIRSAQAHNVILANSGFTAGLLHGIGVPEERVSVLVGGVDVGAFSQRGASREDLRRSLGLPVRGPLVLTACRLEAKKGLDTLLAAFGHLQELLPETHLVIVGDGRERTKLARLIEGLGLSRRVTVTGAVPHGAIPGYFRAADVFVLASRDHINPVTGLRDVETMGRVLLEANAAGLPVVATATGGIPSVIEDGYNGILVQPESPEAIAGAVSQLLTDQGLAQKLAGNGQTIAAAKFDWSHVLGAHERVFERLLAERVRR